MTNPEERERLIKEIKASSQKMLIGAYEFGKCLMLINFHEPRKTFVELLDDFGLTEIEGEAICKIMRSLEKPEDAVQIAEILGKATMRRIGGGR